MSPEAYKKKTYSCLSNDLYSASVIMFVLATGLYPQDPSYAFFQTLVRTQDFEKLWSKINVPLSTGFKDFFERMMLP